MPYEHVIMQLLDWSDRVEHGAEERRRAAEAAEDAAYMRAVEIELGNLDQLQEQREEWRKGL